MSSTTCTAVLIDTVSIQQYIFSSNKLKENIGASYIIEDLLYKKILISLLRNINGFSDKWVSEPDTIEIKDNPDCDCELGFIGGGNAMIFFRNTDDATSFIRNYTLKLLTEYPGIKSAFGINKEFDFNNNNFAECKQDLFDNLLNNKSFYSPQTIISKHGITADCPLSSEAAEFKNTSFDTTQFISAVSKARLDAAEEARDLKKLKEKYPFLGDKYTFTEKFEELGQQEEKGYIAVVHIDGNSMGKRFKELTDLPSTRKLSIAINEATEKASISFGTYVTELIASNKISEENGFKLKLQNGKYRLPYRPIITGGDDITFVCDGRLGVRFAEKFIHELTKNKIIDRDYNACAGVTIVKTKYPFYRAVKLAEELCSEAKKPTRGENNDASYIDFYISSEGFSGRLENIRRHDHSSLQGNLHFGPYKIKGPGNDDHSIDKLKENLNFFNEWPRNKVMELRDVLLGSEDDFSFFEIETKARRRKFPKNYGGKYQSKAFEDEITPYYDIIDLIDFYPSNLLNDEAKTNN